MVTGAWLLLNRVCLALSKSILTLVDACIVFCLQKNNLKHCASLEETQFRFYLVKMSQTHQNPIDASVPVPFNMSDDIPASNNKYGPFSLKYDIQTRTVVGGQRWQIETQDTGVIYEQVKGQPCDPNVKGNQCWTPLYREPAAYGADVSSYLQRGRRI